MTTAATPDTARRTPSRRALVVFLAVVVAIGAAFASELAGGRVAAGQSVPANYGWQFQDVDGPGVPGGNGRSTQPVQSAGTSTIVYGNVPHVFYRSGGFLRHAWAPPTGWAAETLDGAGGGNGRTTNAVGSGPSTIILGQDLHVFYADTQGAALRHSWYSASFGRWFAESLDGPGVSGGFGRTTNQVGGRTATLIFNGTLHIFYSDLTAKDLRHAWWTGTRWQFETLDGAGGAGGRVSNDIAAGIAAITVPKSSLAVQVFYRDDTTLRLRHAAYNASVGAWQFQDLDGPGVAGGSGRQNVGTGLMPAVTLYGDRPQVFFGNASTQLRQGWVGSSGTWSFATLRSPADCGGCAPGGDPTVTLYNGLPNVVHHDSAFGRLLLTRWSGTAWVNETLDGNGVAGNAGRTSGVVGVSTSAIQFGVQLLVPNVDATATRLRQAWFGPAPPANLTLPTISGTVAVGNTLTASTGTWANAPTSYAYQWQRCVPGVLPVCTDVVGATAAAYAVTAADIASALTVRVRATNTLGPGNATAALTAAVPWPAPTVTSLSTTSGPDTGGTTVVITGQNFAAVTAVTFGGTAATYTVNSPTQITATSPAHAAGSAGVVVATATGTSSSSAFTYTATLTPPVNLTVPEITGTAEVGQVLTSTTGTWTKAPTTTTSQWLLCGSTSHFGLPSEPGTAGHESGCSPITGADGITYTVTDADIGYTLAVQVVSSNAAGDSDAATSLPTSVVPLPAPTITAVSPDEGPTVGGRTVTATGTYFAPGKTPTVTVGGDPATNVTVVSATELTFDTPVGSDGAVDVVVSTTGGSDTLVGGYTYVAAPTVTAVAPSQGPTAGGQSVTVTGTNFVAGATSVAFGGTAGTSVSVSSPTQLTVVAPAASSGTVGVAVTTPGGTASLATAYTYVRMPTITSLTPAGGPVAGGTPVALIGTNLDVSGLTVTIGGNPVANMSVVFPGTLVIFSAPAGAEGAADVVVTTSAGTKTSTGGYTYYDVPTIAGVDPHQGPTAGGQSVTVTGTDFVAGATSVSFGAVAATSVSVVSPTELTVVTPASPAGAVDVTVTTPGGSVKATSGYEYLAVPTVVSVSPTSGPEGGGQTVTVTGTDLVAGATGVTFDGVSGTSVSVVSPTELTVATPAGTPGTVDVVVTTPGGDDTLADAYTYLPAPTIGSVTPDQGPTTGGQAVTVTGTDFVVGQTTVTVDGVAVANLNVASPTELGFDTPAGVAGAADVVVTTNGGTATATDGYTYYDAPTVSGIDPDQGPTAGGQSVTVTGSNFVSGATSVSFGGAAGTSVSVVSSTELTVVTPAGALGAVDVDVVTVGGDGTLVDAYTYLPVPTVASVSPTSGPEGGGQTVTVSGTGFVDGVTSVTFDGASATAVSVVSSTELTVESPAGSPGTVDVVVTTPGGNDKFANSYTYLAAPTLVSVTPDDGPEAGGTSVVLAGTHLDVAGLAVTIGGAPVANLNVVVPGSIVSFDTPAGVSGATDVVVTTDGGSATATDGFTYRPVPTVTTVTPEQGPTLGGQTVTITGTGFVDGATGVTFGGTAGASVSVASSTELSVVTPAHSAGAVDVVVTTVGGSATATAGYTYLLVPTVDSVSPTSGPQGGGQTVTVSGTGFVDGATSVTFDGVPGQSVSVVSSSELTVESPAGSPGTVDVAVTTPGGSVTHADAYTYLAAPTIVSVTPDDGPLTGGTAVTLTGTHLDVAGLSVTVGGAPVANLSVVLPGSVVSFATPAGVAGAADVVATTDGGSATATSAFTYRAAPTVSSVAPNRGATGGGATVTVSGTGFVSGATSVSFGGAAGTSVSVTSPTSLSVVTPAGAVGDVDVTVSTVGGSGTLSAGYAYLAAPTVSSASPLSGPQGGGQTVMVTGTGFVSGATSVTFGGVAGTSVSVASSTELTVAAPAGTPGAVTVAVTTPGGTGSKATAYTYLAAPTIGTLNPTEGPIAGGTSVTLTGTHLDVAGLAVTLDGAAATGITVTSATQITFTTPSGSAGTADVVVTTNGGSATKAAGFTYTAPVESVPSVTALQTGGNTTGHTVGASVTFASDGSMIVTGSFTGSVKFGTGQTNETTLTSSSSSEDIFVASYGSDNQLKWVRQAGGSSGDRSRGVAIGANGNIVISGYFQGTATFGSGQANQTALTTAGSFDVFVAAYDSSGVLQWVRKAGGTSGDQTYAVAVGGTGSTIAITGVLAGTATFGSGQPNATTLTAAGSDDIFVAAYDSSGVLLFAQKAGGTSADGGRGIAVDSNGDVTAAGFYRGTGTFGAGQTNETSLTAVGVDDVFVARYNTTGALQWVRTAGGAAADRGQAVAVNADGVVFMTGYIGGAATFGTAPNAVSLTSAGTNDVFVAAYNSSGVLQWARSAGGSAGTDYGYGIAVKSTGIVVTGQFASTATFGAGQANVTSLVSAGSTDVFVAAYDTAGVLQWVRQEGGTSADIGNGVAVSSTGAIGVTGTYLGTATFCDNSAAGFFACGTGLTSPLQAIGSASWTSMFTTKISSPAS